MKKMMGQSHSQAASFSRRLAAYSATAGAALAITPAAPAAVHTITSLSVNDVPTTNLDLNFANANATDTIKVGSASLSAASFKVFLSNHASSGHSTGIVGFFSGPAKFATAPFGSAVRLNARDALTGRNFNPRAALANFISGIGHGNFGPRGLSATKTGYVDFKVGTGAAASYGWLRVKVTNDNMGKPVEFALLPSRKDPTIFGAFDSIDSIAADGFTAGSVPEPATLPLSGLGLLALGAVGVRELRRRAVATVAA